MALRVVFHGAARRDLLRLYNYIADRSGTARAGGYLDRIEAACRRLGEFPEQGRRRDDIEMGLRTVGFERRVRIAYRVCDADIEILSVL